VGIPKNYRHMEGFGVHTYTLVNKAGKVTYVKFHWQPACGARLRPPDSLPLLCWFLALQPCTPWLAECQHGGCAACAQR
jgi:hypothetical protein